MVEAGAPCMEAATCVVGTLLVALNVAVTAWPHVRKPDRPRIVPFLGRQWRKLRASFAVPGMAKAAPKPDALGRLACHRLGLRRVSAARLVYLGGSLVTSLCITCILINIVLGRPRWLTPSQVAIVLGAQAVLAFIHATPTLTPRLLGPCYWLSMLVIAMMVWRSSPVHLMFSVGSGFTLRVVASFGNLDVASAIAANLMAVCATALNHWQHAECDCSDYTVLMFDASSTVILLVGTAFFKQWSMEGIHQEIQFGILKSENSASMSLLDMVCDVVVELGNDMTIGRDSRALKALLLRSSEASLAGVPFGDLIADPDERSSFAECKSASGGGPEVPVGTCRVHLSDSLSNPVGVDVFSVRVSILDEECRYILGLREFSDAIPAPPSFARARQKPRRDPAREGTPPSCASGDLGSRGPPGGAPAPEAPQQRADSLRFPGLLGSKPDIMRKDILYTMSQWNVALPRTACCPFHAYVKEVQTIARRELSHLPCIAAYPNAALWVLQCQNCASLLDEHVSKCYACSSGDLKPLGEPLQSL